MGDMFSPPGRALSLKEEAALRKSKLSASASSRPSFTSSSASWHSSSEASTVAQYSHHQPLHASYSEIPSNSYYGAPSNGGLSSSTSSLPPPDAPFRPPSFSASSSSSSSSSASASFAGAKPSPPPVNLTQQQLVAAARKSWSDKTLGGLDPSGAGQSLEDRRSFLQNLTSPPSSSSASFRQTPAAAASSSDVDPALAYATRLVCSERRTDLAGVPYQTYVVKVVPPSTFGRPVAAVGGGGGQASNCFQVEHRFSSFFKLSKKLASAVRRRELTLPPPPSELSDLSGSVEVLAFSKYAALQSALSRVKELNSIFPPRTFSVLSNPVVPAPSSCGSGFGPAALAGSARVVAGRELALDRWLLALCECLARRDVEKVSAKAVRDVVTFLNVGDKDVLPCERENNLFSREAGGDEEEDEDDEDGENVERCEPRAKSVWEATVDALRRSAPSNPLTFTLGSAIRSAARAVDALTDPKALDSSIPLDLLRHAAGIAFLTVVKGGLFVTARVGTGLVVRRIGTRTVPGVGGTAAVELPIFSPPAAIGTVGMGYGWAGGADVSSVVIILTTDKAVKSFSQQGTVTFGGELAVAIGPLGRTANGGLSKGIGKSGGGVPAVGSGANWEEAAGNGDRWFESMYPSPAYSYSHSKGLFAGVSLEGSVIAQRPDVNHRFYGRTFEVGQILGGDTLRMVRRDEGDALTQAAGGSAGGALPLKKAEPSKRDKGHVACWPLYDAIDQALTPSGDEGDSDGKNMAQQAFSASAQVGGEQKKDSTKALPSYSVGDGDRPLWQNPNGGGAEPNPFARAPLAGGMNRY